MFPVLAINNSSYAALTDSIFDGQFKRHEPVGILIANNSDFCISKPIQWVLRAFQRAVLAGFVFVVAFNRVFEQMSRIDTLRRIAGMAHTKAVGQESVFEKERDSVGTQRNPLGSELPVSVTVATDRPQPAFTVRPETGRFIDVRPEASDHFGKEENVEVVCYFGSSHSVYSTKVNRLVGPVLAFTRRLGLFSFYRNALVGYKMQNSAGGGL